MKTPQKLFATIAPNNVPLEVRIVARDDHTEIWFPGMSEPVILLMGQRIKIISAVIGSITIARCRDRMGRIALMHRFRKALCRWFGHRWLYDGWWKSEVGWRQHRVCQRCGRGETFKTNTKAKPLDVVQP